MQVDFYEYEGLGYIIDPESDTKEVFIPSPPTMTTVKINPRPVIIYVTGGKITETYEKLDELKGFCEKNKVMLVCPSATEDEELARTYEYVTASAKKLNVKKNQLSVKADKENLENAQAFVDYICDELDADVEDAELFD